MSAYFTQYWALLTISWLVQQVAFAANLVKSVAENDQNQILPTTLPFYSSLVCHVTSLVDTIRGAGDVVGLPVGTSLLHLFLHLKHSYY